MKFILYTVFFTFVTQAICGTIGISDLSGVNQDAQNSSVSPVSIEPEPLQINTTTSSPPTTKTTITTSTTSLPTTSTTTPPPPPTTTSTTSPPTTPPTTPKPSPPTPKPTPSPTTPSPTPPPTTPAPKPDRKFDGLSFFGGIVVSAGLLAIGVVAYKFYEARRERNYHTL